MDKTIDRWTDPDGNGYAFKDTVARAQNREMINKISTETADRKAEVNTERKRIDNLIASGTAQTQEIGKKIIQDSSISSSGIVLKGLTNNNYYYKLFEKSGSIDSEFCTITNQQGKYTAKLLKPGLYYMNFKVHVEMSGGFSEEVIAPLKLFKSNTLDWSTFDVLDAETVEISKTENTSINKKIHFLYRITEPSYIRIYIDVDTSHTKTITFRIDSCDIIALDWKGKQSANLSELHDLRIGADGVVHNTAGEAVRKQIGNLTKELGDSLGYKYYNIKPSWTNGGFYNRSGSLTSDSHASYTEIEVKVGEKYHIVGYNAYRLSLYSLRDSNKGEIKTYPDSSDTNYEKRKFDEYITIPEGVKYLCVSKWYSFGEMLVEKQSYTRVTNIEKRVTELEDGTIGSFEYENIKKRVIENQIKNDFAWEEFDGLYATITFDDTNADIDQLQDLAEELGIPFCYATIPSKLENITSQGTETAKQVLERAVANGGEVLAHWGPQLNSLSKDEDYYNVYVGAKRVLTENGFEVNGIITAGGGTDGTPESFKTQNFLKDIELARIYYKYADLTANDFVSGQDLRYIEQFYNNRTFTDGGVDATKSKIDVMALSGKGWLNLASHGTNNANTPTIDSFRQIFQYAKDKGFTFVTWNTMYEKFKSSKLEKRVKALEIN